MELRVGTIFAFDTKFWRIINIRNIEDDTYYSYVWCTRRGDEISPIPNTVSGLDKNLIDIVQD